MKKEKKKKKKVKNRDITEKFAGEDGEVAAPETEKLGDDAKKKSEKKRVNSEAEDVAKKSKKKFKEKCVDSEAHDDNRVKKSKKKNEEKRTDSESEDAVKQSKKKNEEKRTDSESEDAVKQSKKKKSKRESGGDEIGNSESSKVDDGTDDGNTKTGKRKRDDTDLGAEENTESSSKEMKRKSKKKKSSVDSEVEEDSLKKSKDKAPSEDPEVEENNKDSTKDDAETKQTENSEGEENDLNSTKDAKKKGKKKKKQSADDNNSDATKVAKKKGKKKQSEAEENNNGGGTKDAKKKRKKQNSTDVPTPSSKSAKKVKFSDQVEIFPAEEKESEDEEDQVEEVEVVRGKRFTKEEDELIRKAVLDYIDNHALGDGGLDMILECKSHPQVKGCWKEITAALPWRAYNGVYNRAHTIFEAGSSRGIWTKEDLELVVEYQKKHGNDWRALADAMGKNRKHVKDAWRRVRLTSRNKGHWSREEYQSLFDLVNTDLRMKAFQEKHSKHGMLRDNIPWMAISDQLGTRTHIDSCSKWYDKLMSPMVAEGVWANVDDYRLLDELTSLDAACIDDVDWDTLLENRDGEACRKRWNQMVHQIGLPGAKTFAEQVEILSQRYCPELAEDREDFDNRPFDPED